jgi:hypothetical protein
MSDDEGREFFTGLLAALCFLGAILFVVWCLASYA